MLTTVEIQSQVNLCCFSHKETSPSLEYFAFLSKDRAINVVENESDIYLRQFQSMQIINTEDVVDNLYFR